VIGFLWHGRLFGGGPPPPTIVSPPSWGGGEFITDVYVFGSPATAYVIFTISPDGTWSASSSAGTETGQVIIPPGVGVLAAYKARFTITSSFGAATVVNGAATATLLSAARSISIEVVKSTGGSRTARRTVLAELLDASDIVVASGSFDMVGIAEYGT
jgi:hypothetical protein